MYAACDDVDVDEEYKKNIQSKFFGSLEVSKHIIVQRVSKFSMKIYTLLRVDAFMRLSLHIYSTACMQGCFSTNCPTPHTTCEREK